MSVFQTKPDPVALGCLAFTNCTLLVPMLFSSQAAY